MKLIKYRDTPQGICLTDCPFNKSTDDSNWMVAVSSVTCTECESYICELPLIKVIVCKQNDNWEAV